MTRYRVIQDPPGTWSFVVSDDGTPTPNGSGPWRYAWEAQEHADKLNGDAVPPHQGGGAA